jgi:hypothetical protein
MRKPRVSFEQLLLAMSVVAVVVAVVRFFAAGLDATWLTGLF